MQISCKLNARACTLTSCLNLHIVRTSARIEKSLNARAEIEGITLLYLPYATVRTIEL